VRAALDRELAQADERLLAVRVRLEGATRAHGELRGRPEFWVEQVRAQAAAIGPDELWVEKVLLETRPARDASADLERDDALSGLLRSIQDLEASTDRLADYAEELADLKRRLPADLFDSVHEPAPWEPQTLGAILDEAKDVLLARLLDPDGGAR
jgi:hypothetical protein